MGRFRHIAVLSVTVACALWLLHSCNAQSPAYNRENIKATWIVDTYDGQPLDEKSYTVMTFSSSYTVTWAGVLTQADGNFQWGENTLMYDVYCCDLSIAGTYSGLFGHLVPMETSQEYSFVDSQDSLMTIGVESWMLGGAGTVPEFSQMTMRKLPSTYADADTIYGVWQFNSRNGEDFSAYRLQFQPDGVLTMSQRTGENSWMPMGEGEDYYRLYDDYLTMTLYDNHVFGTPSKWDVKCFLIDSISTVSNTMSIRSGADSYILSYISSN